MCTDHKTVLDDKQYKQIVHALGLTPRNWRRRTGRRWAYRNYFAAGAADVYLWRNLVKNGLAEQICAPGTLRSFHTFTVTPKGIKAANLQRYVPRRLWGSVI